MPREHLTAETQRRRGLRRGKGPGGLMIPKRVFVGADILLLILVLARGVAGQDETPPMPSQRLDPKIQKIVSEVSAERIPEILKKLESFETRNTLSDPTQPNRGIGIARQWIFDQFKSYSQRMQVSFD